jgi:hypothetical protein
MLLLFLPLPLLINIYKFFDVTSAYLIREPSCTQVPTGNGGISYVEIRTQVLLKVLQSSTFNKTWVLYEKEKAARSAAFSFVVKPILLIDKQVSQ